MNKYFFLFALCTFIGIADAQHQKDVFGQVGIGNTNIFSKKDNALLKDPMVTPSFGFMIGAGYSYQLKEKVYFSIEVDYFHKRGTVELPFDVQFAKGHSYRLNYLQLCPKTIFSFSKSFFFSIGFFGGYLFKENTFNTFNSAETGNGKLQMHDMAFDCGPTIDFGFKFKKNVISVGCQYSLLPFTSGSYTNNFIIYPITYSRIFNINDNK